MKNLNKYFSALVVVSIIAMGFLTSCEDTDKSPVPETTNGGFIKFVSQPDKWEGIEPIDAASNPPLGNVVYYHIGEDPSTASFTALTEDPNNNATSYELMVLGNFDGAPDEAIPFKSTTSFPFDVSFTTNDMAALFGVDASVFQTNDSFEFMAIVGTNNGNIYNFLTATCECPLVLDDPNSPGTWNGGTIDSVLLQGGDTGTNDLLPAMRYRVKYKAQSED